ncbi:MAG TPA: FAD/NAD(P)-binding oxidoreductase [Acidimicrobiales bacterium]|nr:FAD/NAD(P)-binding oxidoreductase [Acidimicrobiales bacterium]
MTGAGGAGPTVVVVGASLAGLRAVEELRHQGFEGAITVVGAEPHLPYDRPPLSKQLLAGEWGLDRVALTVPTPGGLDGLGVDWRLGTRAVGLDTARRRVALEGGEELPYDGLVIATGATPRRLPGTDGLAGVHTLRTLDDALAIRAELDAGAGRVVVIGAGFIGAEVAATCRARGHAVTLLEALPVPLERALGREMGTVVAELHRDHGVDLRLGVGVAGFEGDGRVERVRLADGSAVPADLVVVGIGVSPATDWLAGSGLALDDGVVCDATTLAAPGIVVAGDVARWPSRRLGELVRVEHWDNAVAMGAHAARRLLAEPPFSSGDGGEVEPYDPVPWFWSDQYDRKVQLAGWTAGAEEVAVVDGSTDERRFVAIYRRGGALAGVLSMNRPRPLVTYRRLVEEGASWEDAMAQAASA